MYLLDTQDGEIPTLRARLGELGDSVVVVGGEGLWNVHVHTDDVGAAIEAALEAGADVIVTACPFCLTNIEDAIKAYAGEIGLKIILDHHRNNSGAGASENGLWYDSRVW